MNKAKYCILLVSDHTSKITQTIICNNTKSNIERQCTILAKKYSKLHPRNNALSNVICDIIHCYDQNFEPLKLKKRIIDNTLIGIDKHSAQNALTLLINLN